MSADQKVTVNVDLDEIREQTEKFADAGRYGPAHVLFEFLATHTPKTMAEVEWDDDEHHLAEATAAWTEGTTSEVVMLHRRGGTIAAYQLVPNYTGLRELNPDILTPTGRKYRMEPAESVPEGDPIETGDDHAPPAPGPASPRPEDVPVGEPWQVEIDGQAAIGYRNNPGSAFPWATIRDDGPASDYGIDADVTLIARLVPETTEQDDTEQEFDPAYTYSDRAGDKWSYVAGGWRWGGYIVSRPRSAPPAEYGPYTRIEDTNE